MNLLDIEGTPIKCKTSNLKEILFSKKDIIYFPQLVVEKDSNVTLIAPTPLHGRSLIVNFNVESDRYVVTKGNGLTYFPFGFIATEELENYAWGYLRKDDAIRDYHSGEFINKLGILTNQMEAVYTLQQDSIKFSNYAAEIEPAILQYSVICPYRISDIPFLSKNLVSSFIKNWTNLFAINHAEIHCTAAEVLLKNIKVMHENEVLHNAIHSHNYTLSLELLDFEMSRTPVTLYENENDETFFRRLQKREIIQSLEIINQIAYYFNETINTKLLRQIMIRNGYENYLYSS